MAGKQLLDIKFTGQKVMLERINFLVKHFPAQMGKANLETAEEVRDIARRNIQSLEAVDTGDLHDSIGIASKDQGLRAAVGSTAHYAPYIEFGTRPHFPPLAPIRAWCERRGLPASAAFPIARKISILGTPERPFLYPAAAHAARGHAARVRELYRALTAQLPGKV